MNSIATSRHSMIRTAGIGLAILLTTASFSSYAQQKAMTIEELETYIGEQKAALDKVKANRDETEQKALEIQDALAEQDARRLAVEKELEALCNEQEELKPGSLDSCKQNSES